MCRSGGTGPVCRGRGKGRTARNLVKAVAPGRRRGATALLLHRDLGRRRRPLMFRVRPCGPGCKRRRHRGGE